MTQSILCLGDSYTIGEGVPLHESFPYILLQMLRESNQEFFAPEIVAKTGWTSFELLEHLSTIKLNPSYDFVTLLVGVNNQYRGLSSSDFKVDFELLLTKAIEYAKGNPERVIVISIPDWGCTPFAADRDSHQIANEIDAYNLVCETLAKLYKTHFVNITSSTRLANNDLTLLTTDKLHYSKKEHEIWAKQIFVKMTNYRSNIS